MAYSVPNVTHSLQLLADSFTATLKDRLEVSPVAHDQPAQFFKA
jgi:hypothetical protein